MARAAFAIILACVTACRVEVQLDGDAYSVVDTQTTTRAKPLFETRLVGCSGVSLQSYLRHDHVVYLEVGKRRCDVMPKQVLLTGVVHFGEVCAEIVA